eukprot:TRINITY_DN23058_c0_g1_i1.p1 TRINITY_DN23058_c0_g1~~TRINITY_DN23058_c0_g1_i1.p1  ORF type:complete len:353 (+),score=51.96 TRINITY_DN23058_c0_g1_i1:74-1132(+)
MFGLSILLVLLLSIVPQGASGATACQCANSTWCEPLQVPPRKEVFIFHTTTGGTAWKSYNYTYITTISVFGDVDPDLLCYAHSQNVRVTIGVSFPEKDLISPDARAKWVESQISAVDAIGADGINIDIEGDTVYATELTLLTQEANNAFKQKWPFSQVTFDTEIDPLGLSNGYDFKGLAANTDFLFLMAYDMCWDTRVATANSPLGGVQTGINDYLNTIGVDVDKIVLGLPWYGYDFPCEPGTSPVATTCPVTAQFTANWQIIYSFVMALLPNATNGLQWDNATSSPFFNYVNTMNGIVHQVWFDNAASLEMRISYAREMNLRGVGVWTGDFLPYGGGPVDDMWDTFSAFFN